ncbi:hypothetical protein ACLB2K_016505 [Fragaria x ananassa]
MPYMPPKKKPPVKKQTKKSPPKQASTKKPKAIQERKRANASDIDAGARKSSPLLGIDPQSSSSDIVSDPQVKQVKKKLAIEKMSNSAPESTAPFSVLVIANEATVEASKPKMAGEEAKSTKVAKMRLHFLLGCSHIKHKTINPPQEMNNIVSTVFGLHCILICGLLVALYVWVPRSISYVDACMSRCSPKSFRSVVSQFSDVKKAACEELGFVMGLHNGGEEIIQAGSFKDHPELMDIVNQFSRSDGKIYSKELVRYLVDPQTVADDKFKQVFVWFTLTTIHWPTASLSLLKKWLVLLKDTSRIPSMNWAAYSFLWLMNGIKEFKGDKTYYSGNLLFLQLFYMDCVKSVPTIVDKSLHPIENQGSYMEGGREANNKVSTNNYEELAGKVASLQDGLAEVSGKMQEMMAMMQTLVSTHNKAKAKEANTEASGCVAIAPHKPVSPVQKKKSVSVVDVESDSSFFSPIRSVKKPYTVINTVETVKSLSNDVVEEHDMNKAKTKVVRKERIGPFRVDASMDKADKAILKFAYESEFPLRENIVDTGESGTCTWEGAQNF